MQQNKDLLSVYFRFNSSITKCFQAKPENSDEIAKALDHATSLYYSRRYNANYTTSNKLLLHTYSQAIYSQSQNPETRDR